jgi:hypothetical protein
MWEIKSAKRQRKKKTNVKIVQHAFHFGVNTRQPYLKRTLERCCLMSLALWACTHHDFFEFINRKYRSLVDSFPQEKNLKALLEPLYVVVLFIYSHPTVSTIRANSFCKKFK